LSSGGPLAGPKIGLSRTTVPEWDKEPPMRKRAEKRARKQPIVRLAEAERLRETLFRVPSASVRA
jgi:hypothetical protein